MTNFCNEIRGAGMTNFYFCKELMGFCIARGDFDRGDFGSEGFCPRGILSGGILSGGVLSGGDFVLSPSHSPRVAT